MNLRGRVRFWLDTFYGFEIFFLCNSVGGVIGACGVAACRNPRFYGFAQKDDFYVGPYVIDKTRRRQGLASLLVRQAIQHHSNHQSRRYFIETLEPNIGSRKVAESVGAKLVGRFKRTGILRKRVPSDNGEQLIYLINNIQ